MDAASFNADGTRLVTTSFFERPVAWDLEVDPPAPTAFGIAGWSWYVDGGSGLVINGNALVQESDEGITIYRTIDTETLEDTGVRFDHGPRFLLEAGSRERGLVFSSGTEEEGIYDLETGELVIELGASGAEFAGRTFNGDGTVFAFTTDDGGVTILDTQSWEPVGEIPSADDRIAHVAYSPQDTHLLTAGISGTITLRDATSLEPVGAPLIGHRSPLGPAFLAAGFSPQNDRLLTVAENELALWDIETRQLIGDFWPGRGGGPSANGMQVYSLVGDHAVIWHLDTDAWFDIACQAAGRNMTRAEWERFGPRNEDYRATCPQWPMDG